MVAPPPPASSILEQSIAEAPLPPVVESECECTKDPFVVRVGTPMVGFFLTLGVISTLFAPSGLVPDVGYDKIATYSSIFLIPTAISFVSGNMLAGTSGALAATLFTIGVATSANESKMDKAPVAEALYLAPLWALLVWYVFLAALYVGQFLPKWRILAYVYVVAQVLLVAFYGIAVALFAVEVYVPFEGWLAHALGDATEAAVEAWTPLAAIFVEPAKVTYLDRDVVEYVATNTSDTTILPLLTANPGPGVGLLLAMLATGAYASRPYAVIVRSTSLVAVLLLFFFGTHDVYFIFALIRPRVLIALILGGMTGLMIFDLGSGGVVRAPSPRSFLQIVDDSTSDSLAANIIGIVASAFVSGIASWLLLRTRLFARAYKGIGCINRL